MRAHRKVAAASALMMLTAACSVVPQLPPPLPSSFIPEPSVAPSTDAGLSDADGFTAVERMSMRVRGESCTQYLNGSAWVLDEHTLVTNRHVVEGAFFLEVTSYDGRDYAVTGTVTVPFADLALMTVDEELPNLAVIADEGPDPGQGISIVGYPEGDRLTTTTGLYLQPVEDQLGTEHELVYQVTASSKPGSSGSPLLNAQGEVIGVIYAGDEGGYSYAVRLPTLLGFLGDPSTHEPIDEGDCEW